MPHQASLCLVEVALVGIEWVIGFLRRTSPQSSPCLLAWVGWRQIADTRILQRAYLSVERAGIEWSTNGFLVGQVIFKNVGKLPATEFVSVVKKIEVQNADWVTPDLTDNDLPKRITGVIPIGAEAPEGSEGITLDEVKQAEVAGPDKYLYVWGRARFKDGFNCDRHVNFCHRYPLAMKKTEPQGPGYSISAKFARISTAITQID